MRRRELILGFGGVLALPRLVRAAGRRMPVVGDLAVVGMIGEGILPGLREAGFIEGGNVRLDRRYLRGRYDRLPAAAAELVRRQVDVICAHGPAEARAAKAATATIPIVFSSQDPVLEGLVKSLARPGGNLTGVSMIDSELMPKRFQLLRELMPGAKAFGLLVNPNAAEAAAVIRNTEAAARANGMRLHVLKARNHREIYAAFDALDRLDADGLIVDFDALFNLEGGTIAGLAAVAAVPAIYAWRGVVQVGGLMSYGASIAAMQRLMGLYVGKILNGANPADLPVVQVDKFEMAINLKTARALDLTVPQPLLALADRVIE
jgi:ABC-type uncharacterized transport system substrate-binding protein